MIRPMAAALLHFVPEASEPAWHIEHIEHEVLPLVIACAGEQLAVVTMQGRSEIERQARRRGARIAGLRSGPSPAAKQLREYFAGQRQAFELELVTDPRASDFEQQAWAALCRIPFGETRSYGGQARMLGKPGAARAVGRANSRNPIGIVVPCHRIIGADGTLTGFAGGLSNKRWLLAHEGVRLAASAGPSMPAPSNQLSLGW